MHSPLTRRRVLQALAASSACAAAGVSAQAYPSKPLRMVVGFAPGGAADVLARIIARGLGAQLGQQVVVENKPGAESTIAAVEVMRAPPDGYTLLLGTNTAMVAVPALRPNPPYDPFKAFTPLSTAGEFTMFLTVSPQLPARNVNEFLDLVASNPGRFTSASSNSAAELAMLQLLGTRGVKVTNVRYKGDAQAMTDMANNQIHMMFTTGTLTPTWAREGKVRALLTLLPQRSPLLPDVPTAAELGIGKLTIAPWAGFFGPAGMPPAVVDKLSTELRNAMARPDVRDQLVAQGFAAYGMSSQEFAAYFKRQWDGFVTTVKENNVKFE